MNLTPRRALAFAAPLVALVALAGCAAATDEPAAVPTPTVPAFDGAAFDPGVSGEIVLVSDASLQVQDDDSQTAVTWDDATTFQVEVDGSLADVTVGVCIVALGGDVATNIVVSQPVDGECTGGFGGIGQGGELPEGFTPPADGELPEGVTPPADGEVPDGVTPPTDGSAPGGFGGGSFGLVTAVDGSTITVEMTGLDGATTSATVTVDDATTVTTTVDGDASALVVGSCVSAQGESDDSGDFAATSMRISTPGDEGCSTGFAGVGRPGVGG